MKRKKKSSFFVVTIENVTFLMHLLLIVILSHLKALNTFIKMFVEIVDPNAVYGCNTFQWFLTAILAIELTNIWTSGLKKYRSVINVLHSIKKLESNIKFSRPF